MAQKFVAETDVIVRAFDESRHVTNGEPFPIGVFQNAYLRSQRRERIRGNLRTRARNRGEQSGLAGVRITDEADLRHDAKFQKIFAFRARFARLRETRRLMARGRKIAITQSAAPALAQNKLLAVRREVGDERAFVLNAIRRFFVFRFLAQINFQRRFSLRRAEERTLTGARAEHHVFTLLFVFFLVVIAPHFFLNRRRGVLELPHERAARNLDD